MRDILVHPARTVFVVLSIAVGVFAVAVMMGGRAVLVRGLDSSFPATVPSTVTYSTTPFDEHLVRSVERQPGVVAAQGRHISEFRYRVNGGPWNSIMLNAFKNYDDIRVGKITPSPGSTWPARNEVLVEDASLASSGLKLGDSIEVETPDNDHPVFRVTGTAHDLGAAIPLTSGSVVGYVSWDSLQALEDQPLFNQLDVRASGAVTSIDQAAVFGARLRDRVIEAQGPNVTQMVAHEPNRQSAADLLDGIGLLLVVIGLLTLLLSGFLVVNTISALVSQQVRQIGIMKAIGARRGQLATMFFAITLGYGALALLIAIPLGQLGSNWFVGFLGEKLDYFVTDRSIPAPIVAAEIALGTLVPLVAAAIPVFLGMRVSVREALYESNGESKGFGTGVIDRLLGRLRGVSRPFSLALRNAFRRKGRLALTLTTLSLAAALFIAVASVRGSILTSVEQISNHRAGEDFVALMYPAQPLDEVTRAALRVTGVTAAEGWIYRYGVEKRASGTESPTILVTGLPADTKFFKP
ncbi:MAG: ABC transporter permease, partial [Coriobacteriia bacterium]|nr:ABC transporter permease [Coriobacteriia bacterium]